MWTILFDIDGTLITARGAGMAAMKKTVWQMFEITDCPDIPCHGRTDRAIIAELFAEIGRDLETDWEPFVTAYCENLAQSLIECDGRVLPGVVMLLEQLADRDDVHLGLLTGNLAAAASIKLQHFGLDHHFTFGGFGDQHANRDDVASVAALASAESAGDRFSSDRVWVIGDTVHDVTCGKSIGAKTLAVETGGHVKSKLISASPDLLLPDLSDPSRWIASWSSI